MDLNSKGRCLKEHRPRTQLVQWTCLNAVQQTKSSKLALAHPAMKPSHTKAEPTLSPFPNSVVRTMGSQH